MRQGCISVGYTGTPGDGGHIRNSDMYKFTWLPKGYGPSMKDRTLCALFDPQHVLESRLGKGERHPLVEAIAQAIEKYMIEHPDTQIGWLDYDPPANAGKSGEQP